MKITRLPQTGLAVAIILLPLTGCAAAASAPPEPVAVTAEPTQAVTESPIPSAASDPVDEAPAAEQWTEAAVFRECLAFWVSRSAEFEEQATWHGQDEAAFQQLEDGRWIVTVAGTTYLNDEYPENESAGYCAITGTPSEPVVAYNDGAEVYSG